MSNDIVKTGLTTGACAQATAKACALMLTTGDIVDYIDIELPNGETHTVSLINQKLSENCVCCGVIKDSGEERNDVTNGIEICCEIRTKKDAGIDIIGGKGVGKATRHGLAVKVGESAINPTPRKMIMRDLCDILPPDKGYTVEISVPKGEEIAQATYNPRLGVVGGISIIGTTGIVKPKSEESYKKSLMVELSVAQAAGYKTLFIASGYLGERLLTGKYNIEPQRIIKVGDHLGFMLKACLEKKFSKVMVIGHIGKLAKVAAGLFNTHSKSGDARMETIAAYAAARGAAKEVVREILNLSLAEASIDLLNKYNLMRVFDDIAQKVTQRCQQHCGDKLEVTSAVLSLKGDIIGRYPENIFEVNIWERFIS